MSIAEFQVHDSLTASWRSDTVFELVPSLAGMFAVIDEIHACARPVVEVPRPGCRAPRWRTTPALERGPE
jgi:hypothetical protein